MRKKLLSSLLLGLLALPMSVSATPPTNIQDGNILHCFDWPISAVKAELANIAAAGYGSIQLSPLQRGDVGVGSPWHDLYRPYDLAFKGGLGSEQELKDLCSAASTYGIKIIVDVVANHVDKTSGYHDTWWDSNGRVRWNGGINNYSNRYEVTHNQLGDYGDVNSESDEVQARAKAYIQKLADLGVKGIRWDAAKHIALPSEGCNFWKTVTSVQGVWHYGEILDEPASGQPGLIKEYAQYMSVTDNKYSNGAAKDNGGIPFGYGGAWVVDQGVADNKVVYWGESHDTYSNDEWSQNVDQSVIDRAYASMACRNGATALYFARPNAKGFNNIKVGKGTDAFKSAHIAAVNNFRNAMVGKADFFTNAGNAISVTRKDGGAVIVMKGSGNVSIANGGGYCPAGTYTDKVNGGTFTVTASTISGNVGSSGIAVIYNGGDNPDPNPNPNPDPTPGPTPTSGMYVLGDLGGTAAWTNGPGTGVALTQDGTKYVGKGVTFTPAKTGDKCYFNFTDYVGSTWDDINTNGNRYGATAEGVAASLTSANTMTLYAGGVNGSACGSWTVDAGSYDISVDPSAMSFTIVKSGDTPNPDPTPGPTPTPGTLTITGDYNLAYSGNLNKVHYWGGSSQSTWPGVEMTTVTGSDGKTYKVAKVADGTTGVLFNSNGDADKTGDLAYTGAYVMDNNGATSTAVTFSNGNNPNPNPGPTPTPGDHTVYFDNSSSNWSTVYCYTWTAGAADQNAAWPGVAMTKVDGNVYSYTQSAAPANVIFTKGDDSGKTADLTWVDGHIYKADGTHQEYQGGNVTTKPVVSANPGNTQFATSVVVTLSVTPSDAKIYYTTDGSTPSASSKLYSAPLTFTETTTLKAVGIATDGTVGNVVTYTYTFGVTPIPGPTPVNGDNLITDYYSVNPNGQVGTANKSISLPATNSCTETNALKNWDASDLIAQGVARDVCMAFKGVHERPVIDSYSIYAAWDNENLYLGVQTVYTVWDIGGEGKQPGESKPHNMDGRLVWGFDLDPNKKFDGYINGTYAIWNKEGDPGIKFDNGVDAMWVGSTKPGNGNPGFFTPTPEGHASYDAPYLKASTVKYGYANGLLPSITEIWGYGDFSYDPELLKGNSGFVDLSGEIDKSAHTFYEFAFPFSLLGIDRNYLENTGIGVQFIDVYGSSGVGGTPYDPAFFDNAKDSYSMDPSSSKEKEDEDILTYSPARVGKLLQSAAIDDVAADTAAATTVSIIPVSGGVKVVGLQGENVQVVAIDGRVIKSGSVATSELRIELPAGMYVVRAGSTAKTVMVK